MQPPNEQLYIGHDQLRSFFGAIKSGTVIKFHNLWYDKTNQQGAGEFTFGDKTSGTGVTRVVIVKLEKGRIKEWREYFKEGPFDFEEFTSSQKKNWKWTIDNYP